MEDDDPAAEFGEVTLDEDDGQRGVNREDHKLTQLHESYVPNSEIYLNCASQLCPNILLICVHHFAHLVSCSPFPPQVLLNSWSHQS